MSKLAFTNSIVAGTKLVRQSIQSPNFVTGVSGWSINKDGSAEFLDLEIRGEFSTGPNGTPHIIISDSPLPPFSGVPRIALYSNDPQEIAPAFVANFINAAVSWFEIDTSNDGFGINQLIGIPPQSATNSGGWLFATTASGTDIGHVELDVDMQLRIMNANNINTTTQLHGFQLGDTGSFNIAMSDAQIESRNNGLAAILNINEVLGGDVEIGTPTLDASLVALNDNQVTLGTQTHAFRIGPTNNLNLIASTNAIQGRSNGTASPIWLQPLGNDVGIGSITASSIIFAPSSRQIQGLSSTGVVGTLDINPFGGDITCGDSVVVPSMAPTVMTTDTAGGATASVTYVLVAATNLTFTAPASGNFHINFACIGTSSGAATMWLANIRIRLTNAAGAIVYNPGDFSAIRGFGTGITGAGSYHTLVGFGANTVLYIEGLVRSTSAAATATVDNFDLSVIPLV